MLWALAGLVLLPLLLAQGRLARRNTPRLPPARGAAHGVAGTGAPLRLVVIGESPVAGIGVETYEEALAAQLAKCLAQRAGRAVHWRALGENGIDAAGVLARLVPRLERCDLAVIVLGVNDTTGLTRLRTWRDHLDALLAAVRERCEGLIVLAGVPPMGSFVALPQPLRWWIGLRASLLDDEMRKLAAAQRGLIHVPVPRLLERHHLAADGYHPSSHGCAGWAEDLARQLAGAVTTGAAGPQEYHRPARQAR